MIMVPILLVGLVSTMYLPLTDKKSLEEISSRYEIGINSVMNGVGKDEKEFEIYNSSKKQLLSNDEIPEEEDWEMGAPPLKADEYLKAAAMNRKMSIKGIKDAEILRIMEQNRLLLQALAWESERQDDQVVNKNEQEEVEEVVEEGFLMISSTEEDGDALIMTSNTPKSIQLLGLEALDKLELEMTDNGSMNSLNSLNGLNSFGAINEEERLNDQILNYANNNDTIHTNIDDSIAINTDSIFINDDNILINSDCILTHDDHIPIPSIASPDEMHTSYRGSIQYYKTRIYSIVSYNRKE